MSLEQPSAIRTPNGTAMPRSSLLAENHLIWRLGIAGLTADEIPDDPPAIIAVGGGKGGVGKSIFSANFAAHLAKMGYRVLLADMDIGCSNLHTHFGIQSPNGSYGMMVQYGQQTSLGRLAMQTPVSNLALISGGRDDVWIKAYEQHANAFLRPFWQQVLGARQSIGVDFVILDLGAGVHSLTVDLFSSAHMGITVTLPEPTSIENAYVFLKAVLFNLAEKASLHAHAMTDLIELMTIFRGLGKEVNGTYIDVMKNFAAASPQLISYLVKLLRSRQLGIVINQARSQYEMELGLSMQQICSRYFGFGAHQLGYLGYDESAWKSLRNRRLLLSDFPGGPFARQLNQISQQTLRKMGYREFAHV